MEVRVLDTQEKLDLLKVLIDTATTSPIPEKFVKQNYLEKREELYSKRFDFRRGGKPASKRSV